jgi:DNA-binding response OmpR family regulator
MPSRRILLVDDQRETTRMLRTLLEFFDRGNVIVEVPSGEEAMLEVRRGPFDLVVTGVRLPGITGLELVSRVRKANPEARVIIMTGLSDPEVQTAAREMQADAFFAKPLETEQFMATVQALLGQTWQTAAPAPEAAPPAPRAVEPSAVGERLALLRRDLGARAVFLADQDGRVVMSAGDVARLSLDGLLGHLVVSFSASLKICSILGDTASANVQFFDGKEFDLYTLNAGHTHLLVIVFEGERGARAMGAVMNYGRPCAQELRPALAALAAVPATPLPREDGARPGPQATVPPQAGRPTESMRPAAPSPPEAEAPASEPLPVAEKDLARLLEQAGALNADAFWDAALAEAGDEASANAHALSYAQAQTLGLVPKDASG